MILRTWFNIIILIACSYGAYGVLNQTAHVYTTQHWQYYIYAISPWALLLGSIKAWYRSFIWRRMLSNRQTPPVLSRGEHRVQKSILRPGILEHICMLLFLLAIAAILRQLSIPHISWWIGSLIGAWLTLGFTIKKAG